MRVRHRVIFAAFTLGLSLADAHEGEPLAPHDLWTADAWRLDPLVVAGLTLTGWLYLRGARPDRGVRRWESCCYWTGWLALALSLASPLHSVGEVLFSAHMIQHEVMMLVAAPLMVLGRPLSAYVWALPMGGRRAVGRWAKSRWVETPWKLVVRPLNAFIIHAVVLWLWHAPTLFQATITSDFIHSAQHLSFLSSALIFWWSLIRAHAARRQYAAGALYLFGTMMHTGLLGALLTLSTTVWYPAYARTARLWGLTPLEDQQLAGLVMWVPPAFVYVPAALTLLALWLREPQPATSISSPLRTNSS